MKKPKDIAELASRLSSAAVAPLVVSAPAAPIAVVEESAPSVERAGKPERPARSSTASASKPRKAPNRSTVPLFLRVPEILFEKYDAEAVRRTKATGRGVTAQQVILELLEKGRPSA